MKMLSGYTIANMKSECLGDLNSSDRKKNIWRENITQSLPSRSSLCSGKGR